MRTAVRRTVPMLRPPSRIAYRVPRPAESHDRRVEFVVVSLTRRSTSPGPGPAVGLAVGVGAGPAVRDGLVVGPGVGPVVGVLVGLAVGVGVGPPPPSPLIRNWLLATFQCVARKLPALGLVL